MQPARGRAQFSTDKYVPSIRGHVPVISDEKSLLMSVNPACQDFGSRVATLLKRIAETRIVCPDSAEVLGE